MCARFSSDPVSRLSTQTTRWPFASRWSHRFEPRNPAPPVTRAVFMAFIAVDGSREGRRTRQSLQSLHGHAIAREADLPRPVEERDPQIERLAAVEAPPDVRGEPAAG